MMHDNNLTCEMEWKQIEKTYKHLRGDREVECDRMEHKDFTFQSITQTLYLLIKPDFLFLSPN